MDDFLNVADYHIFTPYVYPETWAEDDVWRQFLSLFILVCLGAYVTYFLPAALSFYFIYDHDLMKHPLFLKNQTRKEICSAFTSIPIMSFISNFIFLLEVRGYSRLYDNVSDIQLGWMGVIINAILFILFTDTLVYWIHRAMHHKLLYKRLHKVHHKWIVPTPFASHAFHPLDGFLQSCPYHIYVFIFPMHKTSFMTLFLLINFWSVSIHDGNYRVPDVFKSLYNGSAHHMDHHVYYNYNYGQFFTLWDRLGGSYRNPSAYEGKGPMFDVKLYKSRNNEMSKKAK